MLRWKHGVFCHVFREELARVLHHASVWSEIAGIGVEVNALADSTHGASSLHPWDLAADLDTDGDKPADLAQLHGYLARVLGAEYDVLLEGDHVHVEWDARRKLATLAPAFQHPAPPA